MKLSENKMIHPNKTIINKLRTLKIKKFKEILKMSVNLVKLKNKLLIYKLILKIIKTYSN
jgi:hypothetical protein